MGQITLETRGAVVTVTLDAPASRNALTPQMLCQLVDAFTALAADNAVRAIVVTGAGNRAFCAGGDLARTIPLLSGDRAPEDAWDARLLAQPDIATRATLREQVLDKPVIAAVNGVCMAAGFELLLGTDIRIAAEHAEFGLPEVKRAVIPFAGSLARLPRQIPHALAMQLLLTGDAISAQQALACGLVNQVVAGDAVLATAQAIAERIAANGPLAVQAVKQTVRLTSGLPLDDSYALEDQARARVLASEDAKEGPRAFMEKRAPVYRGQ